MSAEQPEVREGEVLPPAGGMMAFQGLKLPVWLKFTACILFDLVDMTIGRALLGVSLVSEAITAVVMYALWGPLGLFAIWEAVDVTEQVDGFVPTNTLIAWAAHRRQRGHAA